MATLDDYEIVKDLGAGAFSTVKLAKHKDSGQLYALKIIKEDALENSSTMNTFKNEVEIMQEINHPYIVNMVQNSNDGVLKKPTGETKENLRISLRWRIVRLYSSNRKFFGTGG